MSDAMHRPKPTSATIRAEPGWLALAVYGRVRVDAAPFDSRPTGIRGSVRGALRPATVSSVSGRAAEPKDDAQTRMLGGRH